MAGVSGRRTHHALFFARLDSVLATISGALSVEEAASASASRLAPWPKTARRVCRKSCLATAGSARTLE